MDNKPKSKGTWGQRDLRTAQEMNAICIEFFNKLVVPPEWKFMEWKNVFDPGITSPANPTGTFISIGKLFRDMRTSGIDLMHYRVCFLTFSERGGICEKSIIDYGKFKYHDIVDNKTIEKLNMWIADHFNELKPIIPEGEKENPINDNSDGLQHIRDRYGDNKVIDF